MGPPLLCDKSTLECLGRDPLSTMRRYYNLVVPPVLLAEMLADLTKAFRNSSSRDYVINLANRVIPLGSYVNVSFRDLIDLELSGERLELDGVPILDGGESVASTDGKKGVKAHPSPEMSALYRWQCGDFTAADQMSAEIWRSYAKGIDLTQAHSTLNARYPGLPRISQLAEVKTIADEILNRDKREDLVAFFMEDAGANQQVRARFLGNLSKLPNGGLPVVAPFTHHCVRTTLMFLLALANNLVGTKPTNRIDLEYLYYAPFTNGFSSCDKFLVKMSQVALPEAQMFIHGHDLRDDLLSLTRMWEQFAPEEAEEERQIPGPPENEASVTHKLWQRYMKPGYRQRRRPKLTREVAERLKDVIAPIIAAYATNEPIKVGDAKNSDFLVRNVEVRLNSRCPCGEPKTFGECCWAKAKARGL